MSQTAPPVAAESEDVHCPLCDYDLRAITEPRCPECGYAFTFEELRDPTLRFHPFLFEHHLHDGWRHFWQTLSAGFKPRTFWRTLFPTQPSRPRRLIAYWLLCALPLLSIILASASVVGFSMAQDNFAYRTRFAGVGLDTTPAALGGYTVRHHLDSRAPVPPSFEFFRRVLRWPPLGTVMPLVLPWLLWPWLTFASLMIFRISMRRARVKTIHVLRAALYSGDLVLWATFAAIAVLAWNIALAWWAGPVVLGLYGMLIFWGELSLMALYAYRLAVAYRTYLRFDHPVWTVLASQLVVLIAMWVIMLNLFG